MAAIQDWGIELIRWIQQLSPALDTPMLIFTFMGTIEFYLLFITFLYWVVDPKIGIRSFIVLLAVDAVSANLKILLHQPRPYWLASDLKTLTTEHGYGLPSAHSSDSLAFWSSLAFQVKKRWMWIVAVLLFLLISFSRLYLAVHFPHDVLLGWLVGLLVFLVFARFSKSIGKWFSGLTSEGKVLAGLVIAILIGLAGATSQSLVSGMPDPDAWSSYSTLARNLSNHFTLAGAFFGAVLGYVLMDNHAKFNANGTIVQKILRYILGIAGVFILIYGLDPIFAFFAEDEAFFGYILRFIRYGSASCWAMAGAPWVFLKLKLAEAG